MSGFAGQMRAGGGGPRRGLWLTFLSPFGLELADGCGAEWIGIDIQHGDLDSADVAPAGAGQPGARARPAGVARRGQLGRVLDTGVDGVIVPAVESADQARQLVQAAYFPPRGRRSKGLARVSLLGRRDQPLLLPMVETRAGLDRPRRHPRGRRRGRHLYRAPRPSSSLGQKSVLDDSVVSAITSVIDRTRERGRIAGIFTGNRQLTGRSRTSTCSVSIPTPPPSALG